MDKELLEQLHRDFRYTEKVNIYDTTEHFIGGDIRFVFDDIENDIVEELPYIITYKDKWIYRYITLSDRCCHDDTTIYYYDGCSRSDIWHEVISVIGESYGVYYKYNINNYNIKEQKYSCIDPTYLTNLLEYNINTEFVKSFVDFCISYNDDTKIWKHSIIIKPTLDKKSYIEWLNKEIDLLKNICHIKSDMIRKVIRCDSNFNSMVYWKDCINIFKNHEAFN